VEFPVAVVRRVLFVHLLLMLPAILQIVKPTSGYFLDLGIAVSAGVLRGRPGPLTFLTNSRAESDHTASFVSGLSPALCNSRSIVRGFFPVNSASSDIVQPVIFIISDYITKALEMFDRSDKYLTNVDVNFINNCRFFQTKLLTYCLNYATI
jgi:hypothetical protein